MVLIWEMSIADSSHWAEMRNKLWDKSSVQEHLEDIRKMLKDEKYTGYIAIRSNHEPIGFAEICIREYANGCSAQPVPFLEGIWIEPKNRQQGVGRQIIEKITGDLISQGFHELCSDAQIENLEAHKAHENWGFDETERVVYFRKPLA